MNKSSLLIAVLLCSAACSKVKEIDKRTESMDKSTQKMEKSTQNMEESTEEMSETTEKMSETTEDLKETTSIMYQQIRSKEAEDTREKKFSILFGEEADFGTRVTAAAVYYKSLEFQLWNDNERFDNKDMLEVLYLDAANEFTRRMTDLYAKVNVKKMSPAKEHKMECSFYALAVAIHMNHTFQDGLAKDKNFPAVSFYDLIKMALKKEKKRERLKEYEEVLVHGQNKEIMIELIKARVDIMSALALKEFTNKEDMTFSQKAKALLFKLTGGIFGSIQLPEFFDDVNDASKSFAEKYLDGAVKAKNFLKEIGVEKKLEKTILSAYRNIDLSEKSPEEILTKTNDVKKENVKSMIKQLTE